MQEAVLEVDVLKVWTTGEAATGSWALKAMRHRIPKQKDLKRSDSSVKSANTC